MMSMKPGSSRIGSKSGSLIAWNRIVGSIAIAWRRSLTAASALADSAHAEALA